MPGTANVKKGVAAYLASLPEPKRGEVQALHRRALRMMPRCRL